MLKAKKERNYRKGPTWRSCSDCDHFVARFEVKSCGMNEDRTIRTEGRCRAIGLQHGRQYNILPHYICDDFNGSRSLERIKGSR